MAILLCRKQHTDFGLDALKFTILLLKIKNDLAHGKSWKTENKRHYLMNTPFKRTLTGSLVVDHITVLEHLKILGMIEK